MEALYGGSSNKKARFSGNEYGNDESNLQGSSLATDVNSQLASFLIKVENTNDEEEGFQQSNQNSLVNVVHPLHKLANELNDVDVHVLITRFKDNPVIFKRARDEAYNVLYFQPEGDELRSQPTNYVECKICGKIFTKSGGHLKRHRSRHYPDMDTQISANVNGEILQIQSTPPPVLPTFEKNLPQRSPTLPVISPHEFSFIQPQDRENLARVLTQFCIQERVGPEIFHRSSFIDLVNVLLSFGSRTQPSLMATNILPPTELITTCIYRRFGWLCTEKVPRIQTDLLVYNGAFTVGCLSNLTAISVHYFDKNWKFKQAVISLAPSDELDSALIFNHCLDSVSTINMQKQTLDQLICVSGTNTASWNELVTLNNRHVLCSCDLIERIVDETFDPKVKIKDLSTTDLNVIEDVVSAAKKLMKYAKFQIFENIKVPSETVYKWLKIIRVIEFANEELNQMCLISQNPTVQQMLPKDFFDVLQTLESNRELLSGLINFLKIFRLPIIELQMIEEPTLPLVWPAVMTIKYDLNVFEKTTASPALKTLVSRAQHLIERDFSKLVTKEHKIATFLNPKQRKLQHLMKSKDYEQFKDDLRKQLNIEKPRVEQKVDERRRFYEDDDAENEQIDEIDLYLSTKRFGDQSIVAFWQANESTMPKLASEARRLLATPASSNYVSGNLARYVTRTNEFSVDLITKLIITQTFELI